MIRVTSGCARSSAGHSRPKYWQGSMSPSATVRTDLSQPCWPTTPMARESGCQTYGVPVRGRLRGICDYGQALADDRRRPPRDDLTTSLVEAEVDGERLTPTEIAS